MTMPRSNGCVNTQGASCLALSLNWAILFCSTRFIVYLYDYDISNCVRIAIFVCVCFGREFRSFGRYGVMVSDSIGATKLRVITDG